MPNSPTELTLTADQLYLLQNAVPPTASGDLPDTLTIRVLAKGTGDVLTGPDTGWPAPWRIHALRPAGLHNGDARIPWNLCRRVVTISATEQLLERGAITDRDWHALLHADPRYRPLYRALHRALRHRGPQDTFTVPWPARVPQDEVQFIAALYRLPPGPYVIAARRHTNPLNEAARVYRPEGTPAVVAPDEAHTYLHPSGPDRTLHTWMQRAQTMHPSLTRAFPSSTEDLLSEAGQRTLGAYLSYAGFFRNVPAPTTPTTYLLPVVA